MKRIFLPLLLLFSPAWAVQGNPPEYTKDGRMGTKCLPKYQNDTVEVCRVSISQLAITPDRYHGRQVMVRGTLSMLFEVTGIKSGEHKIWLELSDYENDLEKFSHLHDQGVVVEGRFNAFGFGHGGMWDGAIENITRVEYSYLGSNQ